MISKDPPTSGLAQVEAKKRLEKCGLNEIERKKESSWLRLLFDQFKSPLIYILVIAGVITLIMGEWKDSVVIFSAVLVNTILGFFQETKAEKSLIALRKLIVPEAFVVRDGQEKKIEASQIVPGDLVILKTGEKVPADGVLVEAVDLHVNEAILTGESIPVEKKNKTEVFMGTVVVSGRGKMLVDKTGMETKMGKIAGGLQETIGEETPLKKKIASLSKTLALIFSIICILILIEGLLRGRHFLEMFELSVAIAVASIPEGLVVSMTVILTLGMQRLLKQKALVRKLLAAETLGGVTVICADKTGTLTRGKMQVVKAELTDKKEGMGGAALCNNMTNPLEIAMMNWVKKEIGNTEVIISQNPRIDEIPFSSERKFIAVLNATKEKQRGKIFLSGAPEMVMQMSLLNKKEKDKWQRKLDDYTKKGLRVIAFSFTSGDLDKLKANFLKLKEGLKKYDGHIDGSWDYLKLKWLGLLLFEDPVRIEVKEAFNLCEKAGIKVKVITGDYRNTALAVLGKLDIGDGQLKDDQIMEGWELEKVPREELVKRIDKIVLFYRTTPEQKIKIVEALQTRGHSVAMMGDGVNDALALKKANIGVVVGEASEVAKETADMVLLDSNFNTIVKAVNQGRAIFANIRKVVLYLLSDSFTEVILISAALVFGTPIPLTAVQILWVNLIEDGLPGLALAFEPEEEGLMKEPPRSRQESILNKEVKVLIFIIGFFTDLLLLGLFFFLLSRGMDMVRIRTIIFAGLAIDSLFYIFSCKTLRQNLWHENLFSNKFLNVSVLIGFVMLFAGIYSPLFQKLLNTRPLSVDNWVLIFTLGLINISAIETVKWLFLRKRKRLSY